METSEGQINRLICVPIFSKAKQVVLVNLKTLDVTPFTFLSFPTFDDEWDFFNIVKISFEKIEERIIDMFSHENNTNLMNLLLTFF